MALLLLLATLLVAGGELQAAALEAWPEYRRSDPWGAVVPADRAAAASPLVLRGPRAGYVSFQLLVRLPDGGPYSLAIEMDPPDSGIQADLFRQWYHFTEPERRYLPDALVPVRSPYSSRLPEPDNRVERQTAQAFWVDLWIPAGTPPGDVTIRAVLRAGGEESVLPLPLRVLDLDVPAGDVPVMDHNSYGSSWIAAAYQSPGDGSREFFSSDRFFRLIHAYHRIFYEHRGVFHQLGYGHAGKVGKEFAPVLAGSGRNRRIADWDLYDRHYGPLLDGSAFTGTRRGTRPIPFVYLPVNPEWPASYLGWGEPGYEVEFTRILAAMERHFRERGWTRTRFELFFNHKKRYKGFSWDGDEPRFPEDEKYFRIYRDLLDRALPKTTPVQFVFRADASWLMERQFRDLAGVIDFWVLSSGILGWQPGAPAKLRRRGDIVWTYGGLPRVTEPAPAITRYPLTAWVRGVQGHVHWLAVAPGSEPWFHFSGGRTTLVYPGVRFGIDAPIPSIRLKLQRNCVQDLALLEAWGGDAARNPATTEITRAYNGTDPAAWWTPRPAFAAKPPMEWTNTDIGEAARPFEEIFPNLDPSAWQRVREVVYRRLQEQR